ncbi:hypothetical protein [Rhodobium gokarnense]|uniref:Uncharacterized protein n=1 Tax=Rhodobium gokarnense TaxID=364296 RepID=A0ABT3HCG3_9HYPH|nr:hypothetical protein [Rhodobium gokarnense]MCW2308096.1 hypothetical protein [Rhodobium gokarnense]
MKNVCATILLLGIFFAGEALARGYDFVVTCQDGYQVIYTVRYGDIDPGKEYARVTAARKLAPFHGNSCSASDFRTAADCPGCPREQFEGGTITGDELARLGNGDLTVIPEVAIGVPIKTADKIIKGIGKAFKF